MDLLERDLLPRDSVVACRTYRASAGRQVSLHGEPRLSHILLDNQLLSAAIRDGIHVLQNLSRRRDTDEESETRYEASDDGLGRARAHAQDTPRRYILRQRHRRQASFSYRLEHPRGSSGSRGTVNDSSQQWSDQSALRQDQQQATPRQKFLPLAQTCQVRQGEEGGQDPRYRYGGIYYLLAAVLRCESMVGILHAVHMAGRNRVCGRHLARLDQQRNESRDIRLLEQRLP